MLVTSIALLITSFAAGYKLGSYPAIVPEGPLEPAASATEKPNLQEPKSQDSEDESEDESQGDLKSVKASLLEPCKLVSSRTSISPGYILTTFSQVLCVRKDLGMSSGKIAAQ